MVQTPRFHCRDHVFDPWSGNSDPACRTSWPEEKKGKQILTHAVTWTNAEDSMLSEKPITKGQVLYDSTYWRSLEESDS